VDPTSQSSFHVDITEYPFHIVRPLARSFSIVMIRFLPLYSFSVLSQNSFIFALHPSNEAFDYLLYNSSCRDTLLSVVVRFRMFFSFRGLVLVIYPSCSFRSHTVLGTVLRTTFHLSFIRFPLSGLFLMQILTIPPSFPTHTYLGLIQPLVPFSFFIPAHSYCILPPRLPLQYELPAFASPLCFYALNSTFFIVPSA